MSQVDRRQFLTLALLAGISVPASGCAGYTDDMAMAEIVALLRGGGSGEGSDGDEETSGPVKLAVTYPAGRSPTVFTSGWVFGASCTVDGEDISDTVKWTGTGTFNPDTGPLSRPIFNSEGANNITLSVTVDGKTYTKTVSVTAVSPADYAALGDMSICAADSHGCPACPHPTSGRIVTGGPNVLVNGKPAARVGDWGIPAACCGPNRFEITGGDPQVLINGRAAAWIDGQTKHCGGSGIIMRAT
jgi:uncharacterized Zn-binding protein involved in type VI secretion